jgi:acetyltransferase-like isoleucine patch superfamily enzyme
LAFKAYRAFGRRANVFGDFTVINAINVHLGEGCSINHGVFMVALDRIDIGDGAVLSARAMLLTASLDPVKFMNEGDLGHLHAPIRIGRGVWIGAGAIILPGVTIGESAIVGAGAVVTRDVPSFTVVAGNPAKVIKPVDRPEDSPASG